MMEIHQRREQILGVLRPAFSRAATFRWFVLLVWGVLLNRPPPAVTRDLNAIGLGEGSKGQARPWFESGAFSVEGLCRRWGGWLSEQAHGHRIQGQRGMWARGLRWPKKAAKCLG